MILGIGNALVDILVQLDDDKTLDTHKLPKGSMQLIDDAKAMELEEGTNTFRRSIAAGGSAANTIHGLGKMGIKGGFIGKLGDDEFGTIFRDKMIEVGVQPFIGTNDKQSGKAYALISPDSERTFGTYLGAAIDLTPADLDIEVMKKYKYLYVEGYLVQNHELIENAFKMAKEAGLTTVLDLASYNVVEDNLEFLRSMTEKYIDIVFANEEEAKSFTSKEPEDALHEIADMCELAIVKIGKDGSLIKRGDEILKVDTMEAKRVDTTGAGDLYAAGFLYGLSKDLNLEKCAKLGTLLASNVIEVVGPKMNEERWANIYQQSDFIIGE
jgi:sugar/nucleoside kinase (ribokinase family)